MPINLHPHNLVFRKKGNKPTPPEVRARIKIIQQVEPK